MDDQLKSLFAYTKFHIGMYTTLVGAIVAIFANDAINDNYLFFAPYAMGAVSLFLLAGMFGGLIASSIPEHTTYSEFTSSLIGPWNLRFLASRTCIHLEHTFFWLGSLIAVIGLGVALYYQPLETIKGTELAKPMSQCSAMMGATL